MGNNGQRHRGKKTHSDRAEWMRALAGTLTAVATVIAAMTGLLRLFL
ncbi:hypothetical protein GA0070622_1264 [Micromonospora sediminicola]|uniref:Uncharacterized protein n=1 Tax=Micromonospora sediminicola TaxID=946078 RepID=A0A1A9B5B8_9ACTN|nr:hypothetical protein GA0070622_1264 [Micromonospora sediminicola]